MNGGENNRILRVYLSRSRTCSFFIAVLMGTCTRLVREYPSKSDANRSTVTDGVVHAWVAQKLLECNEIKSFVVNRGAMAARDRFAAAVRAAVQIRRCQSTATRPGRAY